MIPKISKKTNQNLNFLLNILISKKIKLFAAESFTGGLFSEMITSVPGSSKSFELCLVTYSNVSKQKLLDIPCSILDTYGAVSKEVASLMSLNIIKKYSSFKKSISVSCTGIAGPDGGNKGKPVGTTYFSFTYKNKNTIIKKNFFNRPRESIRHDAANFMVITLIDIVK